MAEGRRLFFALWPDQALRRVITSSAGDVANLRKLVGRKVPPERVHLTLLFLGQVSADAEARLCTAASAIRTSAFELVLDQAGCFYRSRAFWLGPQKIPAGMLDLWERLRAVAEAAGIGQDYKPLVPHVTCLHDVRDRIKPVPVAPIHWHPRSFALVHSELGPQPQYHVVSQWPLQTVPAQSVKTVQRRRGP